MSNKLNLSVSPHIHSNNSTSTIMRDVIIALLPAAVAGVVIFGLRALGVIAVCVAVAVISEYIFNYITKKEQTIGDLSAVVTGLLLALNLPANTPLWQAAIGSIFAIIVVKCLFGGIGCNIVNPAITARVFMLIAFTNLSSAAFPTLVDTVAGATPLAILKDGGLVSIESLVFGTIGGAIGETCKIALVLGGIYLLVRRVITWHIPIIYITTTFIFTFILQDFDILQSLSFTLSGGLILGAFFMATDYVTSPATKWGKVIFAVGAGLLTVVIRTWGSYPEGVSFAILLMNILNPYICSWTPRKLFGGKGK